MVYTLYTGRLTIMYKKYCRVIEIRELIHRKMELVGMSELRYRLEEMTYRMTRISGMQGRS